MHRRRSQNKPRVIDDLLDGLDDKDDDGGAGDDGGDVDKDDARRKRRRGDVGGRRPEEEEEEEEEEGEEDLGAGQGRPDCQAGGTQKETGTRQWEGGEPGATAVSRREPGKSAARTRSRSRTSRQQGDKCPLHQLPECGGKN